MVKVWPMILLLCVTCHLGHAALTSKGCEPGWTSLNGNCYLVVTSRLVSFTSALYECANHDASLFYLDTAAELASFKNIVAGAPSTAYWTGLNDMVNMNLKAPGDGVWKWGPVAYVNTALIKWSKSPGNDGQALCGGINLQGNMYDADCNSKQGFICNIDNGVTKAGGCPLGWLSTTTDCYYVSNTLDVTQLVTWQQAKTRCTTLNAQAHLITIDDPNDQSFLQGQLRYLSQTTYLHWTGLTGTGQPGGWKWFNNANFSQSLFNWASEPDNVGGMENCAVIRYNGKFSDRGCNIQQNFICKKFPLVVRSSFNLGCGSWLRANQKCYLFHQGDKQTWATAKQTCRAMNGDLINVKDIDTKSWLQSQMRDPKYQQRYWTALNDQGVEGVYRWGDGSMLNAKTISWNKEPNNWEGSEDCGVIRANGEFNDAKCYGSAVPLCELDSVQACPTAGGTWVSRPADNGTGTNCYLFPDYTNKQNQMSYPEAQDFCKGFAISKTLATGQTQVFVPKLYSVDSASERTFMKAQLVKYLSNVNGYWTALNDQTTEGFWQFGNNPLADTSFVVWNAEPSNLTPDMDCVSVDWNANFFTQKCGAQLMYICERYAFGLGGAAPGLHGNSVYTYTTLLLIPVISRLLSSL